MISRLALSNIFSILAFFSISPIFQFFLGGNLLFLISIFFIIALNFQSLMPSSPQMVAVVVILFFAALLSIYWQDFKLLFYPIYFVGAAIAALSLPVATRVSLVKWVSYVMVVISVGAIVAFVYALIGGTPLWILPNPDGRSNYFYLTSLTNVVLGRVIRPSGIFDEPGTLSFMICFVAAARHLCGMPKKTTWVLLLTGLITLSLAHLVYIVCHLLSEKLFTKKFFIWAAVLLGSLVGLSFHPDVAELLDSAFFSRFAVVDGRLAGDNRSDLLMNAYSYLDLSSFMVGLHSSCSTDYSACRARYGMLGENVLGPLVQSGIFLSLPYYAVLLWLLITGVRRRSNFVLVGLALLLMQRPYVMSFGYALIVCVILLNWKAMRSNIASRSFSLQAKDLRLKING